jgi:hypothetical protein
VAFICTFFIRDMRHVSARPKPAALGAGAAGDPGGLGGAV